MIKENIIKGLQGFVVGLSLGLITNKLIDFAAKKTYPYGDYIALCDKKLAFIGNGEQFVKYMDTCKCEVATGYSITPNPSK